MSGSTRPFSAGANLTAGSVCARNVFGKTHNDRSVVPIVMTAFIVRFVLMATLRTGAYRPKHTNAATRCSRLQGLIDGYPSHGGRSFWPGGRQLFHNEAT